MISLTSAHCTLLIDVDDRDFEIAPRTADLVQPALPVSNMAAKVQVSRTPNGVGQASMDEIADVTVGVSASSMGVYLGHEVRVWSQACRW